MKFLALNNIEKPFFGSEDIAKALGISTQSAHVTAHRYIKNGLLVRIKPNIFVRAEKWKNLTIDNRFEVANLLQVPSYVSLTTALEYYGITTQIQQNYIECISIKRSLSKAINEITFHYSKLSEKLYFAFQKRNGFYIALPEKALLDSVYFASLGRYSLDLPAISLKGINRSVLTDLSLSYPEGTKKLLRTYGFISQT